MRSRWVFTFHIGSPIKFYFLKNSPVNNYLWQEVTYLDAINVQCHYVSNVMQTKSLISAVVQWGIKTGVRKPERK